ncbi:MAG: MarR family EPS-associated transcriptional regulator [Candidatus Omnitrophica bacterium]|nr:MarR family EPS-associated transcriptional regulator [Candidatus Omnitrophota bacterium]
MSEQEIIPKIDEISGAPRPKGRGSLLSRKTILHSSPGLKPGDFCRRIKEDGYTLLSELHKYPDLTQRELSSKLNMSLGKTNYILRQLIKKGLIKMKSFSHNPGKLKKIQYILTSQGLEEKIKLTYHFLKRKEVEYQVLKNEWDILKEDEQKQAKA